MQTINLKRRDIDLKEYKNRHALEDDFDELIDKPTKFYIDGELSIVYDDAPSKAEETRQAINEIRYVNGWRTNGLKTVSRVFGYDPRKSLRKDFCSSTTLAREFPKQNNAILNTGVEIAKAYAEYNPTLFKEHQSRTDDNVVEDFKFSGMPFTSGIINENNLLKYHFDAGNYKNVWSGMLCYKTNVTGGYLSMPEYGIGLAVQDMSLTLFDGQSILHGVTPITKVTEDAKRYTIVYYSLQQMWQCEPLTDEIARIKQRRTELEAKRNQTKLTRKS